MIIIHDMITLLRHAASALRRAARVMPAVVVGGARQTGKSTLVGRVANQATGSAFSFASTYAIGYLAVKYYAGGRKLGASEMKTLYTPLTQEASQLHAKYLPEIQQRAKSLDTTSILNLVRGKAVV